ncbi:MAG: Ig-like domain-containing protein, partial [Thermoanaerobaculia bacterium]|nr:Ig-like domain-containing protein [Thermoanaerobaculia bacterium]
MILSLFGIAATVSASAEDTPGVLYREAFESYAANANPDGWVDTALGRPGPVAAGLFKTASDPTRISVPSNVVYGTRASAGAQLVDARRAGTFSTLLSHAFDAGTGFELTGRALRMNAEGLLGLAVLSQYPDRDDYYLVGMDGDGRFGAYTWSSAPRPGRRRPAVPNRVGLVPLDGTASKVEAVTPASWHRFRIRVSEGGGATLIAASIWPENEPEPAGFEIHAEDASTARLRAGRVAIWSGSRGDIWFDDLEVRSLEPVSAGGPPMISILESDRPMIDGILVNRDLTPVVQVVDDFDPSPRVDITLDGNAWRSGSLVTAEGAHMIRVVAVDSSGQSAERSLSFEIDKTPPTLSVTSPAEEQLLATAQVTLSGNVEGAEWVRVGPPDTVSEGQDCVVSAAAKSWSSPSVPLLDGTNAVTVSAGDRAGNTTSVTRKLLVDTRGPALEIVSPQHGASLNLTNLVITGRSSDERLVSVKVRIRGASVAYPATLTSGAWTATIPNVVEGLLDLLVEASDAAGHVTTAAVGYRIDRTKPEIAITEGGSSFLATVVNRVVGLFVRAVDADPQASVTSTLDGSAYSSGSAIDRDGEHVLVTEAVDRAGNESRRTTRFTIDRMPPALDNLSPPNEATVGTVPGSITGSCGDATRVELVGTALSTVPSNGVFALAGVPFAEGTNRLTLRATDAAGNSSELAYVVTVKTSAPTVEILESGTPIDQGALFNRNVTAEIRATDADATITATLNGAAYSSGTAITADGSYSLAANATDALGHVGSHTVSFRVDKSAPAVTITSPVSGAALATDAVVVTGSCGDATSVFVNGIAATVTSGGFSATVPLEYGENGLVAVGRDDAGNAGRAEVTVTREGAGPAIVLLHPPDSSLTNRPKTEVLGRVITPASVTSVTVSVDGVVKATLTPDAAGDFRTTLELVEGLHAVSATSNGKDGRSATAAVQLTADFTPPALKILANGAELREGARLATSQTLTLDASDAQTPVPSVELAVDGTATVAPASVAAQGGHVVRAIARDAAGNESRLERTFTIGSGGASSGCSITRLDPDPARPAIVVGTSTRVSGRTSAEAVRVGGTMVEVLSGSFCADVQLPREGENAVEIVCVGAGAPIGDPVYLRLTRVTGLPTVAIDSPMEGQVVTGAAATVTGSVGPGVTEVSVNGVDATFSAPDASVARTFVAQGVEIAHGQNVIAVHAKTASGRTATSTRRVTGAIRDATLAITSPVGTAPTGGASIDVSGTWRDVDPSTIIASSGSVVATRVSDTDGTFVVRDAALTVGANTITVRGRDAANREVTAQAVVTRGAGIPSIRIDSPADNTTLASGAAATITVSGSFDAEEGARVEVNGVGAAISGSTYSAEVTLVATPGVPTMLIARVIEPDGGLAVSVVRVTRLSGPFEVRKVGEAYSVFPADGAVSVPVSAQILVGLTHAVRQGSVAGGVVVESSAAQPVAGTLFADREVVAFAPTVPLAEGTAYVVRIKPSLTNGAGETIPTEVVTRFMTEFGAPSAAPALDPVPQSVCGTTLSVSGTAVPNGRVRVDFDGVSYTRTADASGRFSIELPLSAPSGYRVLRVRAIGSDGALSQAAETCILVACESGPSVVSASYDDATNAIAINFSANIDPSSLAVGTSITLVTSDNRSIGGSVALDGLTATFLPSENLAPAAFTLSVTTAVKDPAGRPLVAPYAQSFFPGGSSVGPSPGDGYLTGEVYDATTGRPLAGATVAIGAPGAAGAPAPLPAVS